MAKAKKPLTEEQRAEMIDQDIAAHHSHGLKALHLAVQEIVRGSERLEMDIHPDLMELLEEAQDHVERVRDSILHLQ